MKNGTKVIMLLLLAVCLAACGFLAGRSVGQVQADQIAADLSERMKAAMADNAEKLDVDLLYTTVGIREPDLKVDYVIPLDERSEETLKAVLPDYDEYNGTAYIYRAGLGRKTVFVPGMNDFLSAHPHE